MTSPGSRSPARASWGALRALDRPYPDQFDQFLSKIDQNRSKWPKWVDQIHFDQKLTKTWPNSHQIMVPAPLVPDNSPLNRSRPHPIAQDSKMTIFGQNNPFWVILISRPPELPACVPWSALGASWPTHPPRSQNNHFDQIGHLAKMSHFDPFWGQNDPFWRPSGEPQKMAPSQRLGHFLTKNDQKRTIFKKDLFLIILPKKWPSLWLGTIFWAPRVLPKWVIFDPFWPKMTHFDQNGPFWSKMTHFWPTQKLRPLGPKSEPQICAKRPQFLAQVAPKMTKMGHFWSNFSHFWPRPSKNVN